MKLTRRVTRRARVEIIPMIDTVLMLLIFYMSFSTLTAKEKRIDIRLPLVSTKVPPTRVSLDIVLHVKDQEHILVNNATTYDILSLRDVLGQLASIGQDATVVIEADADTRYQDVIGALDACAQAHLNKVAFRPLADSLVFAQ